MKYVFFSDCVGWPRNRVNALNEMTDAAKDITRQTFLRHVDYFSEVWPVEEIMGYSRHSASGLTMSNDWHVSYHKSKLNGFIVYYFRHSAIEYVWVPESFSWS